MVKYDRHKSEHEKKDETDPMGPESDEEEEEEMEFETE